KEVEITILNLADDALIDGELKAHVKYVNGDGCNMKRFADQQFDVVFSNSVIEHVGAFDRQRLMADEIKRVGKNYYIQTPNYWFPFEPHFLVFGFQFLPLKIKTFFIRRFNIGWFKKIPDYCEAQVLAKSIRLLKKKELKKLFPGANITSEMFLCLAKSFIVYNNIKK
ncbi:MAG: class I SAM-dependent methyltransferase, partial [Alphaproteobacteria bacterium]